MSMIDVKRMTPSPSLLVIVSIMIFFMLLCMKKGTFQGMAGSSCLVYKLQIEFFICSHPHVASNFFYIMLKYKNWEKSWYLKLWSYACKDQYNLTMYWSVLDFWTCCVNLMLIKFSFSPEQNKSYTTHDFFTISFEILIVVINLTLLNTAYINICNL